MGLFATIKDMWTDLRAPTVIAPPTNQPTIQPTGSMGGTQIVQTPPSLQQPAQIHATTPTVQIHGKEPKKKKDVKIVRDPRTIAEVTQALSKIETGVAEKIPTFDRIVSASVAEAEKRPQVAESLIKIRETITGTPRKTLATDIISKFGEGVYTEVQTKPLRTAALFGFSAIAGPVVGAAGKVATPAVKMLPYGMQATRAATRISKVPYLGYMARKTPETLMAGMWGVSEYKHTTAPVLSGEYDTSYEETPEYTIETREPIMREPTTAEMSFRLGGTFVRGYAFLAGAYTPSTIRSIRPAVKALPEESLASRVPGATSEPPRGVRKMMAEEKAVASLIPRKLRLARHTEFQKNIKWEKESYKLTKPRIKEIREELAFKRGYYTKLKHKIRTEETLGRIRKLNPPETVKERAAKRTAEIKKQIEKGELVEIVQPGQYKTLTTGERVYVPGTVQLQKVVTKLKPPKVVEKPLIKVEIYKPIKPSIIKEKPTAIKTVGKVKTATKVHRTVQLQKVVTKLKPPKVVPKVRERVRIGTIPIMSATEALGVSVFSAVKTKNKKIVIIPSLYTPITPTAEKERKRVVVSPVISTLTATAIGTETITPVTEETITPVTEETITPTAMKTVTPTVVETLPIPMATIPLVPLFKFPGDDKKREKTRKAKKRGWEYYITNPIASPFGNSIGKVKK